MPQPWPFVSPDHAKTTSLGALFFAASVRASGVESAPATQSEVRSASKRMR